MECEICGSRNTYQEYEDTDAGVCEWYCDNCGHYFEVLIDERDAELGEVW